MDDTRAATRPSPEGHRADGAEASGGVSRRWFLVGGGVVVAVSAAVGYVVRVEREPAAPVPTSPPAVIVRAAERERALIADLDATTGGSGKLRSALVRARSDHAAHLAALEDLLAQYAAPAPSPSGSATAAPGTPRTAGQLRAAEQAAASAAAHDASTSSGNLAVLLASVSASESSHAAVLS